MDEIVENSHRIIRKGSKSFASAARIFDVRTRESAYMLYAWCRYCDDQIDGQQLGFKANGKSPLAEAERLQMLLDKTQRALSGQCISDPIFIAFQRVVEQHQIPALYPLELLQGFTMDVTGYDYATLEDTLLYCYHVAGVVGVMMAYVMGVRDKPTLQRAADLGIAFQLTNIARDVIEDADAGRVYLPRIWLEQAGVPRDEISNMQNRSKIFGVVQLLLQQAERYYSSAGYGIACLPFRSAWAIATARGVYRNIGTLVLQRGEHAWDQRAVVNRRHKFYHVLKGGLEASLALSSSRKQPVAPRAGLWTKTNGIF
jgi:15-cis-phytoene synthase